MAVGRSGSGRGWTSWLDRRWWHKALFYAFLCTLMMWPIRYFGFVIEDTRAQVLPSLVFAVLWALGVGLAYAGWEEWGRRRAEREEG